MSEARTSSSSLSNTTGKEKSKPDEILFEKKDCFLSKGCYLTSSNDHDDEDFEEEPIKLWS
jgi:hypothetical protein